MHYIYYLLYFFFYSIILLNNQFIMICEIHPDMLHISRIGTKWQYWYDERVLGCVFLYFFMWYKREKKWNWMVEICVVQVGPIKFMCKNVFLCVGEHVLVKWNEIYFSILILVMRLSVWFSYSFFVVEYQASYLFNIYYCNNQINSKKSR